MQIDLYGYTLDHVLILNNTKCDTKFGLDFLLWELWWAEAV